MSEMVKRAARFCGQCGAPLEEGASFCTQCGAALSAYDAPSVVEQQAEAPAGEAVALGDGPLASETAPLDSGACAEDVGAPEAPSAADATVPLVPAAEESVTISFGAVRPVASAYVRPPAGGGASVRKATPIAPVRPTGAFPEQAEVPLEPDPPRRDMKKPALIVGAIIVLVIIVGIGFGVAGGWGSDGSAGDPESSAAASSSAPTSADAPAASSAAASAGVSAVNLSQTYVTRWGQENHVTYPDFVFKYPEGWSLSANSVTQAGESVVLANEGGITVQFGLWMSPSTSDPVEFERVEKVADAAFKPGAVQGSDYSSLGDFSVARGDLRVAGYKDASICYALLPSRALTDASTVNLSAGVPGFKYANVVAFTCISAHPLDARAEQEVVAMLASLQLKDASASAATTSRTGDYILPDSASRLYARSELESLDNFELYLARNEIFARHGRIFVNEDLKRHFGSKAWYSPRYAPDEFDLSVLSEVEKKNAELIQRIEEERGSTYLA